MAAGIGNIRLSLHGFPEIREPFDGFPGDAAVRCIGRRVEVCLDVDAENAFVLFDCRLAVYEMDDLPAHVLADEHHADGAFPTVSRALEAVERILDERYKLVVREVLNGL